MMRLRCVLMVLMLLLMAACSGQDEAVPTLMEMPNSDSENPAAAANPTSESDAPALPASWTPTETDTPTITPSATLTPSVTPSNTITNTPSPTYTASAVPPTQERPVTNLLALALVATPLPREFVQPPSSAGQVIFPTPDPSGLVITPGVTSVTTCTYFPSGGFATIYNTNADIAQRIGCPEGFPPTTLALDAASQSFERGIMIWIGDSPAQIYVLYNDGRYQNFADTYNALEDPLSSGATPPQGLAEPIRGFGKIWRTYINVRSDLGWATATEKGTQATLQKFDSGMMLSLASRTDILVFLNNASSITGSWQALPGQF